MLGLLNKSLEELTDTKIENFGWKELGIFLNLNLLTKVLAAQENKNLLS